MFYCFKVFGLFSIYRTLGFRVLGFYGFTTDGVIASGFYCAMVLGF